MKKINKKDIFINLLLIFFGCLLAVVIAEVTLRILYPAPHVFCHHHPELSAVFIPGDEGYYSAPPDGFRVKVRINSKGLRGKEYSYEKPEGTYRILILGDSMAAGLAVAQDRLFTEVFERKLNEASGKKFEVINAGVPVRSPREEKLFYEAEGYKYKPDLVILAFYIGNDVRLEGSQSSQVRIVDNRIDESQGFVRRIKNVLAGSHLYRFLGNVLPSALPGLTKKLRSKGVMSKPWFRDLYIFAEEPPDFVKAGWGRTQKDILELKDIVRQNNSEFAVLIIPAVEQVEERLWLEVLGLNPEKKGVGWNLSRPNEVLTGFLRKNRIAYLDLLPEFRTISENKSRRLYLKFDQHLNKNGHLLIGEMLFDWFNKAEFRGNKRI